MSIRCGSCKGRHDSVSQVLSCNTQGSTCRHDLRIGQCVTCARWNRRKGYATTNSFVKNPPDWLTDQDPLASGTCSLCGDLILQGQRIWTKKGQKRWAHRDCIVDPGRATEEPGYKSQREAGPTWNDAYDMLTALMAAAERLLPEAVEVEQETSILLLKQVAEDMDYDLSIDLIRETVYGYSLEELGAWDEREELPEFFLDPDQAAHRLEADSLIAWAEQYQL